MKNLTLKAAALIALCYAATATATQAQNVGGSTLSGASPAEASAPAPTTAGGPIAPSAPYSQMPQVTTSQSSPSGSSAYGTGTGSEGMTGPGGAIGTTTNPNFGVSSGTTTSAPGYAPEDAGADANWHNPSATAPVYRQPLYGAPKYNPNQLSTDTTNPPSGVRTNLGY